MSIYNLTKIISKTTKDENTTITNEQLDNLNKLITKEFNFIWKSNKTDYINFANHLSAENLVRKKNFTTIFSEPILNEELIIKILDQQITTLLDYQIYLKYTPRVFKLKKGFVDQNSHDTITNKIIVKFGDINTPHLINELSILAIATRASFALIYNPLTNNYRLLNSDFYETNAINYLNSLPSEKDNLDIPTNLFNLLKHKKDLQKQLQSLEDNINQELNNLVSSFKDTKNYNLTLHNQIINNNLIIKNNETIEYDTKFLLENLDFIKVKYPIFFYNYIQPNLIINSNLSIDILEKKNNNNT